MKFLMYLNMWNWTLIQNLLISVVLFSCLYFLPNLKAKMNCFYFRGTQL